MHAFAALHDTPDKGAVVSAGGGRLQCKQHAEAHGAQAPRARLANLDRLPPSGFTVACFPGGSAAPARVVAILGEDHPGKAAEP